MKNILKFYSLIVVIFVISISDTLSTGFSYWDTVNENRVDTVPIGTWTFNTGPIGSALATDLSAYADAQIALDPNSPLNDVYQQSGNLNGVTATFENISFYDYNWNVVGTGTGNGATSIGFVSLVDRILDGTSSPIHPILQTYSTTPPYPEYNYFTSYDAMNINTNNQYSLRLNYGVVITTVAPITNLDTISFYAARGLTSPDDTLTMDTNRTFTVSVSTDGINWTQLGNEIPPVATTDDFNYAFYTYTVPGGLQGQNLYLQIEYDGIAIKQGNVKEYSRLVIDELIITTN
jgi:hypothetical protein